MSEKTEIKNEVTVPNTTENTKSFDIDYGRGVIVLPRAAAEKFLSASKDDILSLMYAAAVSQGWSADAASEAFGKAVIEAPDEALSFWNGSGVIASASGAMSAKTSREEKTAKPRKLKKPEAALPSYTTDELTEILERRAETSAGIDECERMLGKMFSTSETAKVVGLIDYLGLDGEYIINLCAHCARIDRKSQRYVEKTAFELYDRGITSVEALDEYRRIIEEATKLEGKIRSMFGMNLERALTARERGFIDAWVGKFGYGLDVIGKAYEITVDSTGKAALPYANAILESWNSAGLKTAEDVDAYIAAQKDTGAKKTAPDGTSFNTDDFFEAALRRSYGDTTAPVIPEGSAARQEKRKK